MKHTLSDHTDQRENTMEMCMMLLLPDVVVLCPVLWCDIKWKCRVSWRACTQLLAATLGCGILHNASTFLMILPHRMLALKMEDLFCNPFYAHKDFGFGRFISRLPPPCRGCRKDPHLSPAFLRFALMQRWIGPLFSHSAGQPLECILY